MNDKKDILEESLKKMNEWMASPESDAYFANERKKNDLRELRLDRVCAYVVTRPAFHFDSLMKRLRTEHDDAYRKKAYDRGCEPSPNHKFTLLWDYVKRNHEPVENERIPQDFLGASYFFSGYWFLVYVGQGCFYRVLDGELNEFMTI